MSNVTWIEHTEYNENLVHEWYRSLIKAGMAFGAQRWIASLQRQHHFLKMMKSAVDPTDMFCTGVCGTKHNWELIQPATNENPKLMMRTNVSDPSEYVGVILSATKTIWLPTQQQTLFKFFNNEQTRSQWDVLYNNSTMERMIQFSKGQNIDSNISIYFAHGDESCASRVILQDTCTDESGSILVYATIGSQEMDKVIDGGDSSWVALFSNGIAIAPDCNRNLLAANDTCEEMDNGFEDGSMVTINFQMMGNMLPDTTLSMELVKQANGLISHTVHKIKSALKCW
ncbi:homeobox-leucine zipper protein ROC5-like isoform X2 [Solanum lycopersicum]|uniref:homeobox-leucine zipper protein ROC5-like isoform X2 n=1 Tax=Solanum lycopersicum TaxID=4081 RepID=UPI000E1DF789|nr:homeobox-leucine zipper protein ROC5-like isoform X2 [Solanum lycopersicum]